MSTIHRFYLPHAEAPKSRVALSETESHHARSVLRMRDGDLITVFDGDGREFEAVISSVGKKETLVDITTEISPSSAESPLRITLVSSLIKGDKLDLVIQKAVELGVVRFVPIAAGRSVVDAASANKKLDRWRKIALDACKQSGRARLIEIGEVSTLGDMLSSSGDKVFFSERDGGKIADVKVSGDVTLFIGPEGGWEDSEISAAENAGCQMVTLDGRILKADTGAIVAVSLLQHHFGDLN